MVVYQTSTTSTFIPCGVFFTAGATGVNFNHNTIVMNTQLGAGANFSSFCVNASVAGVRFTTFYNNILVNNHSSTALWFFTAATLNISGGAVDNNNYYVPGGHVGYYNAANRTTLAAWQTATSKDANAENANPPFVSATDLHLNNAGATISNFDQQGSTSAGITTDYDGNTRPNLGTTIPDIGADEVAVITPPVISFTSISPSSNQCTATSRLVTVSVTTPAGTVSGATINYNNGAAGSVAMTNTVGTTWTGTIPAASPTNTIVTWSVTATNSLGGTATYTGTSYQDDPNVGITAVASARPTTVCSGAADTLSVIINKSGTGVIGSGSVNSSSSPTPFSGTYGGMKGQYIILASELTAAGYTAGNITAIGINFVSSVTATYTGLTIQIGNTALSAFPGTLSLESSGLATYYGPTNLVNPTAGVNTFTLSSSFYWDGTSNIIISTNWSKQYYYKYCCFSSYNHNCI
ncbi:MAG: hypothetical protein IPL21_08170 [Saprospirales bacterium]|nr:hypothetical protein [Saprospirales bacterium]